MRYLLLLLFTTAMFVSYQDDDDTALPVEANLRIRIDNRTDSDFSEVVLIPNFDDSLPFGDVPANSLSNYLPTESADGCSFGYSLIVSGVDTIGQLPPLCFVPDPLADGNYRLVLDSIIVQERSLFFSVARFEPE